MMSGEFGAGPAVYRVRRFVAQKVWHIVLQLCYRNPGVLCALTVGAEFENTKNAEEVISKTKIAVMIILAVCFVFFTEFNVIVIFLFSPIIFSLYPYGSLSYLK